MPLDRIRQNVIDALDNFQEAELKSAIESAANPAEIFRVFIEDAYGRRYITEEETRFLLHGDAEVKLGPGALDACGELVRRISTTEDAAEVIDCVNKFNIELENLILLRKGLKSTYDQTKQPEVRYLREPREQRTLSLLGMLDIALGALPARNRQALQNIGQWAIFAVCRSDDGKRMLVIGDQHFSDGAPELTHPESILLVDDGESYVPGRITFHYLDIFHLEYQGRIVPSGGEFDVLGVTEEQRFEVRELLSEVISPSNSVFAPPVAEIKGDADWRRRVHESREFARAEWIRGDLGQGVRGEILKSNLALYADRPDRMRFSVRFATEEGERVPVLVLSVADSVPLAGVTGLLPEEYAGEIRVEKSGISVQKLPRMAVMSAVRSDVAAGQMRVAVAAEYFEEVCELIRQNTGTGKKIVRVQG
ncbi:hypothetical protein [Streptomyces sp. NPDC051014]|uniref:hypothetical protein n=1 Tax=Streptomyces sp. NPDC051014 TaxID=3155751 RepID=UPI00340A7D95